ncbi:MAG: phosphatase PAP2 family protein [Planctomycetota bacterium]
MPDGRTKTGEAPAPVAPRAFTSVDALHALVLGVLLLLCPLVVKRTAAGAWLAAGYAGPIALLLLLARAHRARPRHRLLGALHLWYPLLYVPLVFWSLYYVVPALNPHSRDDLLLAWDRTLLGSDPVEWFRSLESPLLTEVMHLFYVSYFVLPVLLVVWLLACRRPAALRETLFVLCFSFYLCYVGYAIVPAEGPRYAVYGSNEMEGLALTQPMRDVINSLEPNKFDVFPSAHAAVTLVVTALGLRWAPRLGRVMLFLAVGILASLVYTRYHYVVDVVAGAVWAVAALLVGPPLHRRWERRRTGGTGEAAAAV